MSRERGPDDTKTRIGYILPQEGLFKLFENHSPTRGIVGVRDQEGYTPIRSMRAEHITRYRAIRTEMFEWLGVNSFREVAELIDNPDYDDTRRTEIKRRKAEISKSVYAKIANRYGIEGSERAQIKAINDFGEDADQVIAHLKDTFLGEQSKKADIINETEHKNNPTDLMLIALDDTYTRTARFEAIRKLLLMELIASISKQEGLEKASEKLGEFDDFLYEHIWIRGRGEKRGSTQNAYLYSRHDPDTFESIDPIEEISEEEGDRRKKEGELGPHELLTHVRRRTFMHKGRVIPVYMISREKTLVEKVLKMLRKDSENSEIAVQDDLGFMGVFNNIQDMNAFQERLQEGMANEKLPSTLKKLTDSLDGTGYKHGKTAGSKKVKMRKFFLEFPNKNMEIILHTNKSYVDFNNQFEVGHEEFEMDRLHDYGVLDLLFPYDIYCIDMEEARKEKIRGIREEKLRSGVVGNTEAIPEQRRPSRLRVPEWLRKRRR